MKTTTTKKKRGIQMGLDEARALLANKYTRRAKQQVRLEKIEQTIANTDADIEQLEYTVTQLEHAAQEAPRTIPSNEMPSFFLRVQRVYDYLQRRRHHSLNYAWFCLVISSRYRIENHIHAAGRKYLSACTILNYFKKEREMYLECSV